VGLGLSAQACGYSCPNYAPEEISDIAETLRRRAGLAKQPTGEVADGSARKSQARRSSSTRSRAKQKSC
jgi:hypothetical protein